MSRPFVVLLSLLLPAFAGAGEIYGKITAGTSAVADGAEVAAKCGDQAYPPVKTDKGGSFHLVVAESGKCTLTVVHQGRSAPLEVVSYDEGTQADIVLETKDGQLVARRR